MISQERLDIFLETLEAGAEPIPPQIEEEALKAGVPVISRDAQRLIRTILAAQKPDVILEIGTAVGFSSVFMCACSDARIVTIENYAKRIPVAKENIRLAGYEDRITLIEGNAGEILPSLTGPFDLIFLDAAQGQYIAFLSEIRRLLRSGGILITDNVLMDGDLLEPHTAVQRRFRTIYKRLREYLRAIMEDDGLVTTVLPVSDGLAVTVKK